MSSLDVRIRVKKPPEAWGVHNLLLESQGATSNDGNIMNARQLTERIRSKIVSNINIATYNEKNFGGHFTHRGQWLEGLSAKSEQTSRIADSAG